ncbi:CDP-glycerol glycerophosphotransferase family protein [Fictibacillus terranigra]|uniref:CDP-glycerol glycerophosphotransferase family protein n=1 Tax=Fictibacillus terranigra TaxID=3058424 RepID=A0ABT8E238_9BACL|nr:CDP-glycerol glycerophosphotransferase family protein [Fictibacillus sp. CENA-BCM004]MDN4071993.1 CDP-glycerol glycerophosphotransferase family protein [Fictibacillus sp. CENA-BCM004]
MVKEIAIWLYLFYFKLQFTFFKLFPVRKNKVTFVVSFGDNSMFLYEELKKLQPDSPIVFLATKNAIPKLHPYQSGARLIPFENSIMSMARTAYHLATSRVVVVDNYFGLLSAAKFKKVTECIQLWHAAGAIKTFGLKDKSISFRSQRAHKRFLNVYKNFHKVVVGSDAMADIFKEAFQLSSANFLRTGVPRTDLFFNKKWTSEVKEKLYGENYILKDKKVILYAPTYRDHHLEEFDLQLDFDLLQRELGDEYVILLRSHPVLKDKVDVEKHYPGFVFDYSSGWDINEILLVTDLLITDYSSIPYEFSLLNRPMIFYPYDLEEYSKTRGLWDNYENLVPGPVVFDTREMIKVIKEKGYDMNKVQQFSAIWNQYHFGHSSRLLAEYILETERERDVNASGS